MAETVLPVPLDELEDENQMILNDLEFSQKRSEFLQNYRKLLIEFSAKCVCNQNKPLINSIESLETQYKQLFNTDDEIECKPEVFGSENDFQEMKETIGLETDCETAENPNDSIFLTTDREDVEESLETPLTEANTLSKAMPTSLPSISSVVGIPSFIEENNTSLRTTVDKNDFIFQSTAQREYMGIRERVCLSSAPILSFPENSSAENTYLVYNKKKNTILRKSAENIDEINESLIESFVLKEINSKGPQTVSQLMAQNPKEQELQTNSSSRRSNIRKTQPFEKNPALFQCFDRRKLVNKFPQKNEDLNSTPKGVSLLTKRKQTFSDKLYELKLNTANYLNGETSVPSFTPELPQNMRSSAKEWAQQFSQQIKEKFGEVIDLTEDSNSDKETVQVSTKPQFVNLVSTQSSNTSSLQYLYQPVVSHSSNISFQITNESNNVQKEIPSALVMPSFAQPPTLLPILTLPSTSSSPIVFPEGTNLYFVPNDPQPLSTQLGTDQMAQSNSQTQSSIDSQSKPNKVFWTKRPQKIQTNGTKEPTLPYSCGVSRLKDGTLNSFRLKRNELCEVYMQKDVSKEDREESIVMFRCVKCDYKTNRMQYIDRHLYRYHNPNRLPINKLRQMIASDDCFLTSSDRYEMCSVIRRKCVNQENGQTVMGSKLGFKCNYTDCRFISSTSDYVLEHLRSHNNENTFECDICGKVCPSRRRVKDHKNNAHKIKNKSLKCDFEGCSYQTHLPGLLCFHKTSHPTERPFICEENGCSKTFKNRKGLNKHKANVHNKHKVFECNWPGCNKTYGYDRGLKEHILIKHKPHLKIECDLCAKVFETKRRLVVHKNLVHNINNKPWIKCPHCRYKTLSDDDFNKHSVRHKTDRAFKCDQLDCNKAFKTKKGLETHKNDTHSDERPYPCDWPGCDFTFKKKMLQKNHLRTHVIDDIRFQCDYCHNSFKYKKGLNSHIKKEHLIHSFIK